MHPAKTTRKSALFIPQSSVVRTSKAVQYDTAKNITRDRKIPHQLSQLEESSFLNSFTILDQSSDMVSSLPALVTELGKLRQQLRVAMLMSAFLIAA